MKTKTIGQCRDCKHYQEGFVVKKKKYGECGRNVDSGHKTFLVCVYYLFGCWHWKEKK